MLIAIALPWRSWLVKARPAIYFAHHPRDGLAMTLEERLARLPGLKGAETKKMFGGTCFMLLGNMVIGTLKGELIARVGKDAHAAALKRPGARVFAMTGRVSEGFIMVAADAVRSDQALADWTAMARRFNATLPHKPAKAKR
jgi:TfoX/Sxy family transcriptional regulator of competence genes